MKAIVTGGASGIGAAMVTRLRLSTVRAFISCWVATAAKPNARISIHSLFGKEFVSLLRFKLLPVGVVSESLHPLLVTGLVLGVQLI